MRGAHVTEKNGHTRHIASRSV